MLVSPGVVFTTFPGDTSMATLAQVRAPAAGLPTDPPAADSPDLLALLQCMEMIGGTPRTRRHVRADRAARVLRVLDRRGSGHPFLPLRASRRTSLGPGEPPERGVSLGRGRSWQRRHSEAVLVSWSAGRAPTFAATWHVRQSLSPDTVAWAGIGGCASGRRWHSQHTCSVRCAMSTGSGAVEP